jgi:Serine hydrolase (FSH1)
MSSSSIPLMIPLRILCLHDKESCALELQDVLRLLGDRLSQNHSIELVYVNSPLVVVTSSSLSSTANCTRNKYDDNTRDSRIWWWEETNMNKKQYLTTSISNEELNSAPRMTTTKLCEQSNKMTIHNSSDAINSSCSVTNCTQDITKTTTPTTITTTTTTDMIQYRGLDASLMLLRQMWKSSPFWGILGVGQGAAVASLLTLTLLCTEYEEEYDGDDDALKEPEKDDNNDDDDNEPLTRRKQDRIPPPQFAIFVDGQTLLPQNEKLIDDDYIPTLHLVMKTETNNITSIDRDNGTVRSSQQRLVEQFGGTVHTMHTLRHDSVHRDIYTNDMNTIGRFIIEQKMKIMGTKNNNNSIRTHRNDSRGREIVALQTALHTLELEASNVIAEHVLNNPPAALMALIRPQQVAGLSNDQQPRRPSGTTGAPCPVEFLQRKEERQHHHHQQPN